jgi:peptidylprolyl isomerase
VAGKLRIVVAVCLISAIAGCGSSSTDSTKESLSRPKVDFPTGPPPKRLKLRELVRGTGAVAERGADVTIRYQGGNYRTHEEFDSSWDGGGPYEFTLGSGAAIEGWHKGIAGMRVGGRRELIVPPQLAYGSNGSPPTVAPGDTLIYVIDLVAVSPAK